MPLAPFRRRPHADSRAVERLVGLRSALAWAVLVWEGLWRALWPALLVLGLFLALAFLGLFDALPGLAHFLIALGFALAAALLAARGLRRFRWPRSRSARRRLEEASGLSHRPLAALDDEAEAGGTDPAAKALWRAHQRRMLDSLTALRAGFPRPQAARLDPWALRAAVLLLLVLGLAVAQEDAPARAARAVTPPLPGEGGPPLTYEVWIEPPAYTAQQPVLLGEAGRAGDSIAVPEGSAVRAAVHGARSAPTLAVGEAEVPFEPLAEGDFAAEAVAESGRRIAIRRGAREIAGWDIEVVPDRPPAVTLAEPPGAGERGALRLRYLAEDDYGVARLEARIERPAGESPGAAAPEPLALNLPVRAVQAGRVEGTGYFDLTPHPWAGLPVRLALVAEDERGQRGESATVELVLPERAFEHPLARAVIAERRRLVRDPGDRAPVSLALGSLSRTAWRTLESAGIALALVTASARLVYDDREGAVPAVVDLLWATALAIEDGKLSLAERDLRALQDRLQQALAGEATDAELDRLLRELEGALDRYLQAMQEEMERRAAAGDLPEAPDPDAVAVQGEDLRQAIERIRDLMRSGARDSAQQMLAELRDLLENLRAGMAAAMDPQQGAAEGMMRDMRQMLGDQQRLMDETFRALQRMQGAEGRQGQPGQQGQPMPGQGQMRPGEGGLPGPEAQEALRRQLQALMERMQGLMGQAPGALGEADGEMGAAGEALGRGEGESAFGAQGQAMDALRRGARDMMQQMVDQFGRGGPGRGQAGEGDPMGRDPLGRPNDGRGDGTGEDVEIPDESDLQRARQILDELRRRAGERGRPQLELEYIERLIPRF